MNRCMIVAWLLCAWVLWTEIDVRSPRFNFTVWSIQEAFETKAECEEQLKVVVARRTPSPSDGRITSRGFSLYATEATKNQSKEYTFWCLPSATDPRPRWKE